MVVISVEHAWAPASWEPEDPLPPAMEEEAFFAGGLLAGIARTRGPIRE